MSIAERLCRHGTDHTVLDSHLCPYQEDVNNDPNPEYCSCCEECTQDCAHDI